jgi:hypothetical protein
VLIHAGTPIAETKSRSVLIISHFVTDAEHFDRIVTFATGQPGMGEDRLLVAGRFYFSSGVPMPPVHSPPYSGV